MGKVGFFAVSALLFCVAVGWWYCKRDPAASGQSTLTDIPVFHVEGRHEPDQQTSDFELAKPIQRQIWAAEHVTFELEHRLGSRLRRMLTAGELDRISETLVDDFLGTVAQGHSGKEINHSEITETRKVVLTESSPLPASSFVPQFFADFRTFSEWTSTAFRILKIHPAEEHRWGAEVLLTATGADASGNLLEIVSTSKMRFRFLNETDLDKIGAIERWDETDRTLRKGAGRFFEEVTRQTGLGDVDIADNWNVPPHEAWQYRFQTAVNDFNGDGWLDIAVATKHKSILLEWHPASGQFRNVTSQLGIAEQHTPNVKPQRKMRPTEMPVDLAAWIDFDNDGDPDLLLGNRLYRNEGGTQFVDITEESGLSWETQSMGVAVADYDCDGLLDFYVLQQGTMETIRSDSSLGWINDDQHGRENRLWRGMGNGRFRDVTRVSNAGAGSGHSLAATWFHYDDDRYPDLYVANDFNRNVLLRNLGNGRFEDVSKLSGTSDFATSMGVAAGDLNNDGRTDLYVANMFSKMGRRIIDYVGEDDYPPGVYDQIRGSCAGNRLYLRDSVGDGFNDHSDLFAVNGVGWAYAPAICDFDNDGWLDLYATTGFMSFVRHKPDG